MKARDGALAAKAVLTRALAGSEKLNAPVVPFTGPPATKTTGPPTYCFVTPATASMGLAPVEMMPEAERMADAGGSMGAEARLTVVEFVAVTGTPRGSLQRRGLAREGVNTGGIGAQSEEGSGASQPPLIRRLKTACKKSASAALNLVRECR